MRNLQRNKKVLTYKLYLGKGEIVDKYGDPTGDYKESYTEPEEFVAYVTPNTGSTAYNFFGLDTNYSHMVITSNMECPIKEDSLVTYEGNEYVVVKRAKSLNQIVLAIRGV